MDLLRSKTKKAPIQRVQLHQNTQRQTCDRLEDDRLNKMLSEFEKKSWRKPKNAWNLIKEFSRKKKSVTFIQSENRLKIWKDHFQDLLSVNKMIIMLNLTASSCLTSTQKLVLLNLDKRRSQIHSRQ